MLHTLSIELRLLSYLGAFKNVTSKSIIRHHSKSGPIFTGTGNLRLPVKSKKSAPLKIKLPLFKCVTVKPSSFKMLVLFSKASRAMSVITSQNPLNSFTGLRISPSLCNKPRFCTATSFPVRQPKGCSVCLRCSQRV